MKENNLSELFRELNIKTPVEEIDSNSNELLLKFFSTEKEYRKQYRIKSLLKASGIKQVKTFNQFDWKFNPKISQSEILEYSNSSWIEKANNLVLIGAAGLGKSHIASSLCYEAILKGYTTTFINAFDLVSRIKKSTNTSTKIDYYSRIKVLCIDELGYTFHGKEDTDILFQIISKRSESLPVIITTNLTPKEWGTIFSSSAASAILDRLSFNGKFITLEGRSYRLNKKCK